MKSPDHSTQSLPTLCCFHLRMLASLWLLYGYLNPSPCLCMPLIGDQKFGPMEASHLGALTLQVIPPPSPELILSSVTL